MQEVQEQRQEKTRYDNNTHHGFPFIEFVLTVERQPYYFFLHIVSPTLCVVVLAAMMNFIPPDIADVGIARVMTTFVLLLILITFPTFTYSSRPAVKYNTWLDSFMSWSMYLLFWPIVQSILAVWCGILEDRNDDGRIVIWG